MIKITNNTGLLNNCYSCHTQDKTKSIEFSYGTGSKTIICLCDDCKKELCSILIKDIEEA